ncbi:MAG TPA: SdrD B-like domain-containing protein, partial [Candidatus Acidoferrum sp.]|nr:SdrD B-like domain-containing protein [Candidatus Acidoferrum sp.]
MKQNALFACAFAILTVPVAAFAQPTVLISDGVTTIGPIHGSNGTITYTNTNFGDNWSVVIASGTTKPRFGSAASPNMELDVTATSKAPGDSLVIYFSDNSFGPAPGNFTAELDSHLVSGSDGTMSYDTYYDAGNALLATTTPLTASGPLTADNSGATWSGGTVTASPFSLTQVLTLGAGGEGGASYSINANLQAGCSTNGQIGDFVWNDLNRNGCQDEGEPGIQGVQVELYAGCGVTGTPVASTFTDVNGYYLFSGLCPGTYTVGFNTPAGFTRTVANVGCVNTSLPPYENQLDSKCNCSAATRCGVCVTLTTANPVNLNVDCGYTCSSEVVVIPPYAKQDIITVSLIRYGQYSVSISNAPNMGNWSDGPTVYKTATYRLTTADIIRAIAIVLHGNAGYYPASAQLVLVQGEIGGFFGYPYVSTLDDTSTTDGDNIRLASGRNMTNNPAGALPPGHNQPWGQIFVKVYDSKGNVTLCDNVTFFFGIRVEECYDCFYLNSFVTDATFKFLQRTGPPCCAGSSVTSAAGRDRYYMTLQFDNTLNNPYLNPDGVIYPAGTTNGVEL